MQYFVYILECHDGTLYIGITTDLERRIKQHNGEIRGGAKYTQARRPVVLRYIEEYETRSKAQVREAELKQMTRRAKLALIASAPHIPLSPVSPLNH
ncbi:GIY-YIG nuclease family protein [Candidatus Woesebacteria bacterium]|nr:GIY-YIG nuclease family protein [Candidatus Woesebacteria bacterium]